MPTKNQFMACPKRCIDPDSGTYSMVLFTPSIAWPVKALHAGNVPINRFWEAQHRAQVSHASIKRSQDHAVHISGADLMLESARTPAGTLAGRRSKIKSMP